MTARPRLTTSEIIDKLGGPTRLAEKLTARGHPITASAVCRWRRPKETRGTGGHIPPWWVPRVLAVARDENVRMSEADFVTVGEAA